MERWQQYSEKFQQLTAREQYIILIAGLFLSVYLIFVLFIEADLADIKRNKGTVSSLSADNKAAQESIKLFEQALSSDPDAAVKKQITQQKEKLAQIDEQLLALTSDLINPIQMRQALVELLALEPNVSLVSFEAMSPKALFVPQTAEEKAQQAEQKADKVAVTAQQEIGLYRHGIQLTLKGKYQSLQTYLARLEKLKWKFFWQNFEFKVVEYPNNELSVTLYSLSTKRDFIGV